MVEYVIRKWVVVTCVFFMMCPKRSRPFLILPGMNDKYFKPDFKQALAGSEGEEGGIKGKARGFDLTEQEMSKFKIWPQGIIPYFIDDISYDKVLRDKIRGYLETVNVKTGLRFVELPSPPSDEETRWVFFVNRRAQLECADVSTKQFTSKGVQRIILSYDCINGRGIAEIVLALAGVPAQHNAPDRNNFIDIEPKNIMPDKLINFKRLNNSDWLFHDIKYDFNSASHYDFHKYSVNGQACINPRRGLKVVVVENDDFSEIDIEKIKMLYSYISRKKTLGKVSKCSRLFSPGLNFDSYQPENEEELIMVLAKPDKYTNPGHEVPDFNKENETENVTNEDKHVKQDETDNDKDLLKNQDKNDKKQNEHDDSEMTESNEKEKLTKLKRGKKTNLLSLLSDSPLDSQ